MNQSQRRDSIRFDEGLEPVSYHEGAVRQPAGIGALPSGDHGLETVPAENPYLNQYPQVSFGKEDKEVCHINTNPSETNRVLPSNSKPRRRSKRKWWWMAAIIIGTIFIGITVGIVEGLRHKRSAGRNTPAAASASNNTSNHTISSSSRATSTSSYTISTPTPTAPDLSTTGAFNGTGLSMVSPENIFDRISVYFQHFSGEIRYSEVTDSGWSGGGSAQTVTSSNVKNRTQLAGVSGQWGNVWTTYLFYVDASGIVQDVFQSNSSNSSRTWLPGNLGSLNIRVSDSPKAALEACWVSQSVPGVGNIGDLGLYVGEQDGLIHEYTWDVIANKWYTGYIFPNSNGNGGAACWGGELSYLYMQNSNYELQLFWKDINPDATNSTTHPLGIWNPGPTAVGTDIRPNSSSAMSYYAYYQDTKNQIFGIFPNATAENSYWGTPFQVGSVTAMPGTAIETQTFFPSNHSPSGIYVFFQTNASDVVVYIREQWGGPWSNTYVPVG